MKTRRGFSRLRI